MLLLYIYFYNLSLIILTKFFLKQSSKVIGLVLLRFPSNSLGLGMGKIVAFRQRSGIVFNFKIRLNSCIIRCNTFNGKCLIISYEIFDGPVALLLGSNLMVFESSSKEISAVRFDLPLMLSGMSL